MSRFISNLKTNQKQQSMLHLGALNGNLGMVKYALDNGQNIDTIFNNYTALHLACTSGQFEIVEYLLLRGCNVNNNKSNSFINKINDSGLSPLHCAVNSGDLEIVELLIQNNAQVNVLDKNGCSPIDIAYALNHLDIAAHLEFNYGLQNPPSPLSGFKPESEIKTFSELNNKRRPSFPGIIEYIKPGFKKLFNMKRSNSNDFDNQSQLSAPSITHSI